MHKFVLFVEEALTGTANGGTKNGIGEFYVANFVNKIGKRPSICDFFCKSNEE